MSEKSFIPDGIDERTAKLVIAYEITSWYRNSFSTDGAGAKNLQNFVKVFNSVAFAIDTQTDIPDELFKDIEK